MPILPIPQFAAGLNWLEPLLPLLFVAFWIVSQVFAAVRRGQGGQRPPVRIDRPRPQPRPAGGGDGDPRSELERQIDEFLRRNAGEQTRRPDAAPRSRPAPAAPTKPQPAAAPTRPKGAAAAATPAARGTATAGPTTTPTSTDSVARHVQEVFAHDLGHLRGGLRHEDQVSGTTPAAANPLASELAEMLRSPAATRRAILLREVLDRPVDRW